MPSRPFVLAETNWKSAKDTPFEVAILPWGATEPHNFHLPYSTDNYETTALAERAAEFAWNKGAKVVALPTVPFGVNTGQLDLRLAINMEAARAGEQGHGFAVVASEVRRLASSSAEAAQRTTSLVQEMLDSVAHSREATARTVATVEQVLGATQAGRQSLARVEEGTVEGEDLSGRIERDVRDANELISQMTQRLAEVSHGSASFSRSIQKVAVTTEEQSKGVAELAAAASALTDASARISELVATFKLGDS